tara:strand:+ start:538 stop:1245 length:708 start_codon:yes stop_codon:yes gene_type:complete
MPQTQYSAMRGMLAESKIGQSTGAPGLFWEKLMRGEGRETVRDYLQKRANEVASASSALGIKNLAVKGASLAAMALTPAGWGEAARIGIGALSSGGLNKYFGDKEVDKLDTSGLDMSKILYGREEAGEAEDTAQSAINRLIEGVDAQAVSSAFTTPLMYYTLKNTFGGAPTDGGGTLAGGMQSAVDPLSKAALKESSSYGLDWAQTLQQRKTQMASPVNVFGDKPVSPLDYLFNR